MTEFAFREPKDILDSPLGIELGRLEEQIRAGEASAIEARWYYGHKLLRRKVGKQLPKGLRAALIARHGISDAEISYRMQFAELYPTQEEVVTAVTTYKSWTELRKSFSASSGGGTSQSQEFAFTVRRFRTQIEGLDETEWTEATIDEALKLIAALQDRIAHHQATTRRAAK